MSAVRESVLRLQSHFLDGCLCDVMAPTDGPSVLVEVVRAMPKKTAAPVAAPSDADVLSLLEAVSRTDVPLDAKALLARGVGSYPWKVPALGQALEALVEQGRLRRYPGKTASAAPLYWDRDWEAALREAVWSALGQSPALLAAKDVAGGLPKDWGVSPGLVSSLLDELATTGRIHAYPARTKTSGPLYSRTSPDELAERSLRALLGEGGLAESALAKKLAHVDAARRQRTIERLLGAGQLFRHPAAGKQKGTLLSLQPPAPEKYFEPLQRPLQQIVDVLRAAGLSEAALRRALVELVESTGIEFRRSDSATATASSHAGTAPDLLGAIRQLEPGADRGSLVTTTRLRQALKLPKDVFDREVLRLASAGLISLHRHDFPASLTPEVRDTLVVDERGTHYIGIAIRQASAS